jgi:glutamyl-tRNA synthetase
MYSPDLLERIITQLAPEGYVPRHESELRYPARVLADKAEVMRVPPSPTGFVHIGTIYAGLINERIAHQSGGVFILRIEDTDKKREVEGSAEQIVRAFRAFSLDYDEGPEAEAAYGPYFQSQRAKTYLGYAVELLQKGRAYPCFATPDELAASVKDQQAKKVRPGYYGEWALWRNNTEDEVVAALEKGLPFVLRFRSEGSHDKRISYDDVFKGHMEVPENDLDVPLIKSDALRLPTYHLAHVVDDFLMGTTKVFRSDEWLPSTALHIELCQALDIAPFTYGHFAPISIIDKNGGGKRKLSKRKDPEADVQYWLEAGYPVEGIKAYLLGLANSNFEDWYRAHPDEPLTSYPVSLQKLAASRAPLLDMQKCEDYCKDFIARLPQDEFERQIILYAEKSGQSQFVDEIRSDTFYSNKVFSIERTGPKPRKDLAKWGDAPSQYGYFFDRLFEHDFKVQGREKYLADIEKNTVFGVAQAFLKTYDHGDESEVWLGKLKAAAAECQFAADTKAYKQDPAAYKGALADFARILRVLLTGRDRTPDLWTMMQIMGPERVRQRLSVVA